MLVVLGNQLFPLQHLPPARQTTVFMAEDVGLCTYVRHHQQKIVLFLAAMRAYADELRAAGYEVTYHRLEVADERSYEDKLAAALEAQDAASIEHFEIEDKAMESRLIEFADLNKLERRELASPMFTCSREAFASFARDKSRLLMGDFYKQQRRELGVLLDEDDQPVGGRWSFDADNRKKLPRDVTPPEITWASADKHVQDVIDLVRDRFPDHPGDARDFCWPTTRKQAQEWLDDFVTHRLEQFGPYEDALSSRSTTVFHSVLSPCMNLGLLTPREIVDKALARVDEVPLQSLEGFVRQVIGWREFVRGVYREFSEQQDAGNFWSHERELTAAWYDGKTGIPPLDDTIRTAQELGWTHHIPRLMVLGNLMTLCEIRPSHAHRWFMEMFVDSSEWVMGPNVYGMGLFSDGGIFATKPYICGSNYLLKMSDYKKGPWCDIVDGLYWRFIAKHREFFSGNPRLALMPKALDRLDEARRTRIFAAADEFLEQHTVTQ
ncbi:MAG: cryptochrome/photolyase family protein [Gammaproteobacteria bacterium]|nr:cryptochrome/photolyase family protein [Gammaproteobacteria bacterium]